MLLWHFPNFHFVISLSDIESINMAAFNLTRKIKKACHAGGKDANHNKDNKLLKRHSDASLVHVIFNGPSILLSCYENEISFCFCVDFN